MMAVTGLTLLLVTLHRVVGRDSRHRAAEIIGNRRYSLDLRCLS